MDETPQEVFRIAVAGHRRITVTESLTDAIREVIGSCLSDYPGMEIWLYSALAEGGDQLVAAVAGNYANIKLIVPLPLPVEEYLADFLDQDGIAQFFRLLNSALAVFELPWQTDHKAAYRQLGGYLVEQCDALIALWDGNHSMYEGGTAEVVQKALEAGKRVHWIYCENNHALEAEADVATHRIGEIRLLGQD